MALLSRVAESLFWLGRYVERAESTARLLNVTVHGRWEELGRDVVGAVNTWEALLATLGLRDAYAQTGRPVSEEAVVNYLTVDTANPSSVVSALAAARENARSVRDFLSSEAWIAINRAYRELWAIPPARVAGDGLYDFCDQTIVAVNSVRGTVEGTCVHDEGWWWYIAGISLERADMVTRVVDAKYHLLLQSPGEVGTPEDRYQWAALLRGVSGWEAYRRLHPEGIEPVTVAHFLLLASDFPRSLRSAVGSLVVALERATADAEPQWRNPPLRAVHQLQNRLRFESAGALIDSGLHEAMESFQIDLIAITNQVGQAFFGWVPDAA